MRKSYTLAARINDSRIYGACIRLSSTYILSYIRAHVSYTWLLFVLSYVTCLTPPKLYPIPSQILHHQLSECLWPLEPRCSQSKTKIDCPNRGLCDISSLASKE